MKIDVYRQIGEKKEKLVTYTINGIEDVAKNEVSLKNGSSKPKVYLSAELTRSGLIQLNKAEAKVEELVWVDEKPKKAKSKSLKNKTESNETTESTTEPEE
jgi:hypothetical protein